MRQLEWTSELSSPTSSSSMSLADSSCSCLWRFSISNLQRQLWSCGRQNIGSAIVLASELQRGLRNRPASLYLSSGLPGLATKTLHCCLVTGARTANGECGRQFTHVPTGGRIWTSPTGEEPEGQSDHGASVHGGSRNLCEPAVDLVNDRTSARGDLLEDAAPAAAAGNVGNLQSTANLPLASRRLCKNPVDCT